MDLDYEINRNIQRLGDKLGSKKFNFFSQAILVYFLLLNKFLQPFLWRLLKKLIFFGPTGTSIILMNVGKSIFYFASQILLFVFSIFWLLIFEGCKFISRRIFDQ